MITVLQNNYNVFLPLLRSNTMVQKEAKHELWVCAYIKGYTSLIMPKYTWFSGRFDINKSW